MTSKEINKKIEELKEKKKEVIRQERARELAKLNKQRAARARLETRVKIIIGGYVMNNDKDILQKALKSGKLRQQDVDAINSFMSS